MIVDFVWLTVGLVLLIFGGDFLVKGAVGLALSKNISPLIIGMTIVSFGTSAPEMLVCINAALQPGDANLMSMGNIIGSNIANLSLVLGTTAIVASIPVEKQSIQQDWPILFVSSLIFILFCWDLQVIWWEGVVLFIGVIVFTLFMIWKNKNKSDVAIDLPEVNLSNSKTLKNIWFKNISFLAIGIVGLFYGSEWLLSSATNVALAFGVSPYIIGVTILAVGTSIPELTTSIIAAYKKETEIALGNLIGSNIFNILAVVGLTSVISPMKLTQSVFNYDMMWMLVIAILIFPLMIWKKIIQRWMGLVMLLLYVSYVYFLIV
jgi:cation:H+ antiporter